MNERRTSQRIPVAFPVNFAPVSVGAGEGTVVDLASRGCRINSPTRVPVTTYLELRLQVSLQEPPIQVDLANVRWARGSQLGVEFLNLRPEHEARLQRIIEQSS